MLLAIASICQACRRTDFKQKVKAKSYRVVERAGVIWVYMGSRAEALPLPAFEPSLHIPDSDLGVMLHSARLQLLQALEGEIDTSHFGFLHTGHVDLDRCRRRTSRYATPSPAAHRSISSSIPPGARNTLPIVRLMHDGTYWRFGNFLFPFWTQRPQGDV